MAHYPKEECATATDYRAHPFVSHEMIARSRRLRSASTSTEQRVWARLRAWRLRGLKFRRQHPIGPFIADFCCPSRRLVIEIDGDSHAVREEYDQARTRWFEKNGYQVLRFANCDVGGNLDAVLERIRVACQGGSSAS